MQPNGDEFFSDYREAFDYVILMGKRIYDAGDTNKLTPDVYTDIEWTIITVSNSVAIIDNGGFELYLSCDIEGGPDFRRAQESFREIGAGKAFEIIGQVLDCFPEGVPYELDETDKFYQHPVPEKRLKIYRSVPKKKRDAWNSKFWNLSESIIIKLANYIKKNEEKIVADLNRERKGQQTRP